MPPPVNQIFSLARADRDQLPPVANRLTEDLKIFHLDTAEFSLAMMAMALARICVHEANVQTEEAISRARAQLQSRSIL